MKAIMPSVELEGDNKDIKSPYYRIMARYGNLVGWSRSRVVWRFGFLRDSDFHKAFGVYKDVFLWVMSSFCGEHIMETFEGFACELPDNFKNIIDKKF